MAFLLLINIISIIICYCVAKYRNARVRFWFIAALLVGPLAVPFVFFSKPVAKSE